MSQKVKVVRKNTEFSMEYEIGDILEVDSTWFGGVNVKSKTGIPISLDSNEYELYEEKESDNNKDDMNETRGMTEKISVDMQLSTRRYVRPEYMNHHESLFAGYISEWVTEAGFIGASNTLGRTDGIVLVAMKELHITTKVKGGSILSLYYKVKKVGNTSLTLYVEGRDLVTQVVHCSATLVFVNVDCEGKKKKIEL